MVDPGSRVTRRLLWIASGLCGVALLVVGAVLWVGLTIPEPGEPLIQRKVSRSVITKKFENMKVEFGEGQYTHGARNAQGWRSSSSNGDGAGGPATLKVTNEGTDPHGVETFEVPPGKVIETNTDSGAIEIPDGVTETTPT